MYKAKTVALLGLCLPYARASFVDSHGFSSSATATLGVTGQVLEAIGIQLLDKARTVESLTGRLLSVIWGLLLLAVGVVTVLMSIEGDLADIDKVVVVPIIGSLAILGSFGSTLKTLARWVFVRRTKVRNNWQCAWLRRCVMLTNSSLTPETADDFDHYSAFVHLFDSMLEVCTPSVNRGVFLSVLLLPIYVLFFILQILVTYIERVVYYLVGLVFRRESRWKIDSLKYPLVTDLQLDKFEEKQNEWAIIDHGYLISWAASLMKHENRELHRDSWAECMSSLHVANVLSKTAYSALLRRSMIVETRASLFGRIKCLSLRRVAGAWFGRQTGFLTNLQSNLQDQQAKEPGVQLVWNNIICNEERDAPHEWAKLVLSSVETASAGRLKTTLSGVLDDRELNHVATSHEKWYIDVAMYCWWNMTRCTGTDQMMDELAQAKLENAASVIVSVAETILQKDYSKSVCVTASIGVTVHTWLSIAGRQNQYRSDPIIPELPPSKEHYGSRNFMDALEFAQVGVSDLRKEAYAVVAAGLWTTAIGADLTEEQCDQIAQSSSDTNVVLDRVKDFAKAHWKKHDDVNSSHLRQNRARPDSQTIQLI